MKKIYTKLTVDIKTSSVLEEEYFLFDGEMAECGGSPKTPQPSGEEKAMYASMAEAIRAQTERANAPDVLAAEKATARYTAQELEDYMATRDERQAIYAQSVALYKRQLEVSQKDLEELSSTQKLAALTGELSPEEQGYIDTMSQNSISRLTESVNDDFTDIAQKDIAKLAARGVINSNIATQAIADLGERAQKAISQGTVDIESQRMANILSIQEANKNRQLQQQGMEQQERLVRFQSAMGGGGSLAAPSVQPVTTALQTGAGLSSNATQSLQSAVGMSSTLGGFYQGNRQMQYQSALAKSQSTQGMVTAGAGVATTAMMAAAYVY
jgi:hypothetical protein